MNLDDINEEIKQKAQAGATKPSDYKKKRGRPSKPNTIPEFAYGQGKNDNENQIRERIKELDDNLAIFTAKLGKKIENLEKSNQVSLWKIMAWSILAISSGMAGLTSSYCAFKMWNS